MSRSTRPSGLGREDGLSLIELLVTIVIVGILAGVSTGVYDRYLLAARRGDARLALLHLSNQQEKYYAANGGYADSIGELAFDAEQYSAAEGFHYDISMSTTGSGTRITGYTLNARALGRQQKDTPCRVLSLGSTGIESALDAYDNPSSACWR